MSRSIVIILYWAFALVIIAFIISGLHEIRLGAIWKALLAGASFALAFWLHKNLFPTPATTDQNNNNRKLPINTSSSVNANSRQSTSQSTGNNSDAKVGIVADTKNTPTEALNAKGNEEMTQPSETPGWSEEFSILNEYDTVVKECHDELEGIDPKLAEQFREEVVDDRKKATSIRDRLKTEREKKLNPYSSDELNAVLAEARLLGRQAEEEFVRVVEVMGEDIDAEEIFSRIKVKFDELSTSKSENEELEHWGINKNGNEYLLGDLKYEKKNEAIAHAQKKLDDYLQYAAKNNLKQLLEFYGHNLHPINHFGHNRITAADGVEYNVPDDQLVRYVRAKISPASIREFEDYLHEKHDF